MPSPALGEPIALTIMQAVRPLRVRALLLDLDKTLVNVEDHVDFRAAGVRFLGLRNGRVDASFDEGADIDEGLAEVADALRGSPCASASMVRHVPA